MSKPYRFTVCADSMLTTNLPVKDIDIAFADNYQYMLVRPGTTFLQYHNRPRYSSRKLAKALTESGIKLPAYYIFDHQDSESNWVLKLVKGG